MNTTKKRVKIALTFKKLKLQIESKTEKKGHAKPKAWQKVLRKLINAILQW